jgi:pilus assembly protein CpaC
MKKALFSIFSVASILCFSVVVYAESVVNVEINKGKIVRFDSPASSVVVADPTTADIQMVSPQTVFVYGKKIGETSLSAVGVNDEIIFQSVIDVTHNLSSLKRTVDRVSPNSNVTFKTVDGGLIIDGSAVSVQEAENIRNIAAAYVGDADKVVNMLTTNGGDQVTLQVKIVEMSRSDLKNLGINLQASLTGGGIVSQVVNGSVAATAINPLRAGATNIQSTLTGGSGSISSLIEALETQGLATVLAEPSLTTTTGKAASFLAGGQYPIPVAGENGTVTVQYQPFGVSLNFTPVVMTNERMSILVNPEVSTLNFSNPIQVAGFTYPILDTRKAQATVELGSGQTFVLAGLLRNDTSNNISKLPGAGDIPVLGALFRSQRFQSNQTELVILVTPYIVHPVSEAKKIQTPVDGYKPPSDIERLMFGSLYQQQDMPQDESDKNNMSGDSKKLDKLFPNADADRAKLNGKSGFILE